MIKRSIGLVVNVIMLCITAAVFSRLPAEVPTHWNLHGEINGTMAKFPGAFLASTMAIVVWFVLPLLRRIDPRRASYERFDATFYLVVNAVVLILAMIQGLTLAVALGMRVDMTRSMLLGVGLMFIVLGNYMPRLRSNWWMGIRTPWTLESEEVWRRTHRFGGRAFMLAGIITVFATLLPTEAAGTIAFGVIMIAVLLPVVYSYFVWRSERRGAPDA
ncbi:MAG: SdpI family protein [Longimicrobiales bacterium]